MWETPTPPQPVSNPHTETPPPAILVIQESFIFCLIIRPDHVVADFGCGDAKISQAVKNEVHSFDLIALNEYVTSCDMANVSKFQEKNQVTVYSPCD